MTVRIGLLAAARIAEGAVVAPARSIDGVEVVAVAARTSERAAEAARRWNIPRVHGSYRALLDDDDVDAVYIATPNALHRPWAVAALGAGKHVLVEKPIASNAADAERIAEAADGSGLVVMEASHWPYHPWASEVRALVDAGVLGALETVSGAFEIAAARIPRDDIRWDLALGGGATMDLGVYPLGWVMFATGAVPTVVGAEAVCPVPGVDGSMAIDLAWANGVRGRVTASMVEPTDHRVIRLEVVGSDGRLVVDNPLSPQTGTTIEVTTAEGEQMTVVDRTPTYHHQLVAFRDAVVEGTSPVTGVAGGVSMMGLVDEIYRAAGLAPRPAWPDA